MKKITETRAKNLINMGIFPKCEVSRSVFRYIHTSDELDCYKRISSLQMFTLWGYTDEEINDFCLSDLEIEISIDDATSMIVSGNAIYGRLIEEDEVRLTSMQELLDFYKRATTLGETFHIYWKE